MPKKITYTYPEGVDLNEQVTDPKTGKSIPRYWGAQRDDGVLMDCIKSRSVFPNNSQPTVKLVQTASGIMVRNIAEEMKELRSAVG